jgi:hypothetical protein
MNTVAVYHNSVPSGNNWEKVNLLKYFSQGVQATGDSVTDVVDYQMRLTDVAVIQGWQTPGGGMRPHNQLRNLIIQEQRRMQRRVLAVDSSLFLYADVSNPHHYLRYSFDDVFPNTGEYCDRNPDPARWHSISQHMGIGLQDYRSGGDHVLICLQRNGGWSMGNTSVADWLATTVSLLAQHTDRPLVIRPHPGDKKVSEYLDHSNPVPSVVRSNRITVSNCTDLRDDLKNCWAVVNHNSSPAVAAAIEGYPVFVTDPARSQCGDIANIDLANIETPTMPDRLAWVQRIAMSHWNFQELQSGQCWRHMRQFIRQ